MALIRFADRFPSQLLSSSLLDDMPERMRLLFGTPMEREAVGWLPAVEIREDKDAMTVTAELPGLTARDVDVNVDDGVLTISGEKQEEKKEGAEDSQFYLLERRYGSFRRSFTLSNAVDADRISAEFDNGVLRITLPKSDKVKAKGKKIAVLAKK